MVHVQRVLLLIIVLVAVGCSSTNQSVPSTISSVDIKTTYDPAAEFPRRGEYAFVRFMPDPEATPEAMVIDKRIRSAIQTQLGNKGYKIGFYDEVDFLVNYDASLSQDFYLLAAKYEQEGEEWIKVVGFADDYMKGALLVEVIDARKLKPIWRGVCNANVTLDEIAEEEKDERVNYAVKELLRTFPPK